MIDMRDRDVLQLENGKDSTRLFADVEAFNEILGDDASTLTLFEKLVQMHPRSAAEY